MTAASLAQLEEALREDFSLANLAVYGDALEAAGDPRGQLIAIDLHIARHGPTRELAYRRRQRLREWLELSHAVDPTSGPWRSIAFAFGFVVELRAELALEVLRSPAGRFVRGMTLSHRMPLMSAVLHELGAAPRPWLDRLTIASRIRSAPPTSVWSRQGPLLDEAAIPAVIAATPWLRVLELAGHRLLREFPHPHVARLRVDGIDAFLPVLEPAAALPGVTELELMFAHAPGEPVVMLRPWPPLVPAASFPALTRLDLSENWRRAATDSQVDVFDVLPELGVGDQLEQLRLWGINDPAERELFRRARLPNLRLLELEHLPRGFALDLPGTTIVKVAPHWPREPGALSRVWMVAPGFAPLQLPLAGLIRHAQHARSRISAEAYEAWQQVWSIIESLPYGGRGEGVSSAILHTALDGLGYLDASHRDLWPWVALHQRLAVRREPCEVWVTMQDP